MANFLDDAVNFGFGLFAYSKERIEETVEKMVEKGSVAKKDASSFVAELTKRGEEEREQLKKIIDERIQKASDTFNNSIKPITKDDVRAIIKEELEALKKESDK